MDIKKAVREVERAIHEGRYKPRELRWHEQWLSWLNDVDEKDATHPGVHAAIRSVCEAIAREHFVSPQEKGGLMDAIEPILESSVLRPNLDIRFDPHDDYSSYTPEERWEESSSGLLPMRRGSIDPPFRVEFISPAKSVEFGSTAGIVWSFLMWLAFCRLSENAPTLKQCLQCGVLFLDKSQGRRSKFCRTSCRVAAHRQQHKS